MSVMSYAFKILIVDDQPRMCDSLEVLLGGEGYEIYTCNSGKEAIEYLAKNGFDLVLLDIVMPEIGGHRVMHYINSHDPETLVILMTGHASLGSAITALRGGAYDYLRKPVEPEELLRTVKNALDQKRLKTERKRAEEALKRLNEKVLQESKKRKRLSKRLIDLLEMDRKKIAMELHDHIGQKLTALKMDLEIVREKIGASDTSLQELVQAMADKAAQAIEDVMDIAHGLRPTTLDNLGLVPSIRALLDDIKRYSNIEMGFFTSNIPQQFEPEKELAIYRITQEAITNVAKHAQATKLFVNLVKTDEAMSLSVEDNGIGFEPTRVLGRAGGKGPIGLQIMQERVIQLDGEFTIESRPGGGGTHLLVGIPL